MYIACYLQTILVAMLVNLILGNSCYDCLNSFHSESFADSSEFQNRKSMANF